MTLGKIQEPIMALNRTETFSRGSAEGVNIPNFERREDGKPHLEFEMDILRVFRDIEIGRSADSPAILMKQEDTSEGYFVLFLNDKEYRRR